MSGTGIVAGHRVHPGELLRLVADELTAAGLAVRPMPGDGKRLLIVCAQARCSLLVSDCGLAEWECCLLPGWRPDPGQAADLATALLTGRAGEFPRLGSGYGVPDLTFKGIVGLELKARGLDVELEVYEDRAHFDVCSQIVTTSPDAADPATVQVTDDGCVTWTCDYWDDPATPAWEYDGLPVPGLGEVAAAAVTTVTTAITQAPVATSAVPS